MLLLATVFFVGTFGMNFQMTMALMAKSVFDRGAGSYGLLGTALAVGSLAGALVGASRAKPSRRLLIGAALAFGLLEVACGLMPTYWTFMIMLVPTGLVLITLMTTANATVQLAAGSRMRGRVMALYMTVLLGGTAFGAPAIGWLAAVAGPRWGLIGGGLISTVATAVAALVLVGRPRRIRKTPPVRPQDEQALQEAFDEARSA